MPVLRIMLDREPVQNHRTQVEFILKFQLPLLAEGYGKRYQYLFRSGFQHVAQDEARLDCLSKSYFVGNHHAARLHRVDGSAECVDLVRVRIDVGLGRKKEMKRRLFQFHSFESSILLEEQVSVFTAVHRHPPREAVQKYPQRCPLPSEEARRSRSVRTVTCVVPRSNSCRGMTVCALLPAQ